ncbi:tail fiber domain-containing protein [Patescibacteria group bacterium]|nr:tail fiber domain-containing protein [Patescibacteria group bacterium]
MRNILKFFAREIGKGIATFALVGGIAALALAYTEPTSGPVGGTVYAPVNVGGNSQTKSGNFTSSGTLTGNIVNGTTQMCLAGSCISSWPSGGGTSVGSSGYVQFSNGSGGFNGDSNLFWDNTNKRLGIGTASPDTTTYLTVGGAGGGQKLTLNDISTARWSLGTGGYSLHIANDSPSAWTDRMVITQAGNVGINTPSPAAKLTITSDGANANFRVYDTAGVMRLNFGGGFNLNLSSSAAVVNSSIAGDGSSNSYINVIGGNVGIGTNSPGYKLQVGSSGNGTAAIANSWNTFSSIRWKENIKPIDGALDKVLQLQGVAFDWKESKKRDIGFIAEEVGRIIPEIVDYEADGKYAKGLDYARLTAVLVEATKEQQKEIEELKAENGLLQGNINALESRVEALEKK